MRPCIKLCAPLLDRLGRLPGPQRDALRTTFGLSEGPAPDPFFVGLAVLSLLSEGAAERPLVCLIDDSQLVSFRPADKLAGRRSQSGTPPRATASESALQRLRRLAFLANS